MAAASLPCLRGSLPSSAELRGDDANGSASETQANAIFFSQWRRAQQHPFSYKVLAGETLSLGRSEGYGWAAVGVGEACCAAFSLSFATFAVACWRRSASFCRFGFGVGVGLTLAASSEREQAPRTRQQESEIVVRKIFMMKSQQRTDVPTATARARNRQPGKTGANLGEQAAKRGQAWRRPGRPISHARG